jgi:hypothetical protein
MLGDAQICTTTCSAAHDYATDSWFLPKILCLCGGVLTPRLCLSGVKLVNPTWNLDFVSDAIAKPGVVSRVS